MGLARLRTADAGRKTRGLGNASFRSAAIRLYLSMARYATRWERQLQLYRGLDLVRCQKCTAV